MILVLFYKVDFGNCFIFGNVLCALFLNGLFKINNRNTRNKSEICLKLLITTPERRQ